MISNFPGAARPAPSPTLISRDAEVLGILATPVRRHRRQKTAGPESLPAENGGRKIVPSRSPAFASSIFGMAGGCERERTQANQWESLGSPRKTSRKVPVDRPTHAQNPIKTGLRSTLPRFRKIAAENRRKNHGNHKFQGEHR